VWSRRALAIFYSSIAIVGIAAALFTLRNRPRHRPGSGAPAGAAPLSRVATDETPGAAEAAIEPPPEVAGIAMPIAGLRPSDLKDSFAEMHSGHRHEAIDILEPRGTPVLAVDDGVIVKKFRSVPGGITIYQFNPDRTLCYYYAHLERYAEPLAEGQRVARGDTIGFVGTSGNAPPQTPHLHFAVYVLGPERRWWEGTAIDPYPLLLKGRTAP
jgi:murein DD-endopeptidase MepM/ murein hydrolase activator NlpD